MTPFIVGVGHKARAGKDTIAEALCRDLGFTKVCFADPLRDLAMEADPIITAYQRSVNLDSGHGRYAWTVRGMGYEEAKNTHKEVRAFLERLGLGARRVFGEDFWLKQALARAERTDSGLVVMPDVRYRNEAEGIKDLGGVLIRVDRRGSQPRPTDVELADFEFDKVFDNNGTVLDLQRDVVAFVKAQMELQAA